MNPRFVSRVFLPDFSSHISACMERPRKEEEAGLRKVIKRVRQGPVCMPGGVGLGDYSHDMRTKKVGEIVVGYGKNG